MGAAGTLGLFCGDVPFLVKNMSLAMGSRRLHRRKSLTIPFALPLGIAYPPVMTETGQAIFPSAATGSRVEAKGTVIGQIFAGYRYFRTRPSDAGKGFDGLCVPGIQSLAGRPALPHVGGLPAPPFAKLVDDHVEHRLPASSAREHVTVLALNLALDRLGGPR